MNRILVGKGENADSQNVFKSVLFTRILNGEIVWFTQGLRKPVCLYLCGIWEIKVSRKRGADQL